MIDRFLNSTTMYRLVLYYLIGLLLVAFFLTMFGVLPFSPTSLLFSTGFLLATALLSNAIFARTFRAIPNVESAYITALILALIITPYLTFATIMFMFWAAVLAMASKYILSYRQKHFFNPVAISVAVTALTLGQTASWWVGTISMLPWVIIGGYLVVRKVKRTDLVASFIVSAVMVIMLSSLLNHHNLVLTAKVTLLYSPLLFFAFVMLTEPLTTPPGKRLQTWYGAVVGLLFAPAIHLGSIYSTPELVLLVGNIFSFAVSPRGNQTLTLREIRRVAADTYDFVFRANRPISFQAGQFLELTLPTSSNDNRGNRRYFTIASSPTESEIRFGVKFYPKSSRFKQALAGLKPGSTITTGQLSGSFTLPNDKTQKLCLIAGGIGITPFRSQIKSLLDSHQKRDIILLYSNKTVAEIAYADIFARAKDNGVRTVYTLTDPAVPSGWTGRTGLIDQKMLITEVPDYKERLFYLSGPHSMVVAFEKLLAEIGVPKAMIKTDHFPGYV